jgi:putative tryptophan/tyrosine transport system substrate-binding protein
MKEKTSLRVPNSCSDNRKSKIQNLKFAGVLAVLLMGCVAIAQAQQPAKIPRIGYLSALSPSAELSRLDGFRRGLRDLGYVEQKNVVIESRFAEGKLDRLPDLAAELVRLNVDAIVTGGSPATGAAQQATRTIPLVMTLVADPVPRFVASLAKPGGNITGLTSISPQLSAKRLELLKETFPKITRVAVFVDGALAAQQQMSDVLQQTQLAADATGVKLLSLEIRGPNPDLDGAFKKATSERAGGLIIPPGPVLALHRKRFVDLTVKSRLPAMYGENEWPEAGGLMSYGPDFVDLYRRAAAYVDKILKGTKPADLPVQQPTKFEFIINLKAAKQIGLTIPQSVLYRADKVIK